MNVCLDHTGTEKVLQGLGIQLVYLCAPRNANLCPVLLPHCSDSVQFAPLWTRKAVPMHLKSCTSINESPQYPSFRGNHWTVLALKWD